MQNRIILICIVLICAVTSGVGYRMGFKDGAVEGYAQCKSDQHNKEEAMRYYEHYEQGW
jgi:hypothetical protein